MSQFSQLLDELQRGAPEPVRHNPRRIMHDPRPPSRSVAIPKAAPQLSGASFAKALDHFASEMEAKHRTLGARIQAGALQDAIADVADVRARAAALIERANGDMLKAISAGELGAQETAERQILLDAFARRMGLS